MTTSSISTLNAVTESQKRRSEQGWTLSAATSPAAGTPRGQFGVVSEGQRGAERTQLHPDAEDEFRDREWMQPVGASC